MKLQCLTTKTENAVTNYRLYEFQEIFDSRVRSNSTKTRSTNQNIDNNNTNTHNNSDTDKAESPPSLLHVNGQHYAALSDSDMLRLSFERHLTLCGVASNRETRYYDLSPQTTDDVKFETFDANLETDYVLHWLDRDPSERNARSSLGDYGESSMKKKRSGSGTENYGRDEIHKGD
ncbi:unnamed protein product [Anisakis simplex]|uniref:LSM14 domain-containing protein n=1 Tax=Anisakis simplex TaxID=6269 RepID=A0A0M3K020_ANISI|nr:unnamed protein product [Anisakis simplex]